VVGKSFPTGCFALTAEPVDEACPLCQRAPKSRQLESTQDANRRKCRSPTREHRNTARAKRQHLDSESPLSKPARCLRTLAERRAGGTLVILLAGVRPNLYRPNHQRHPDDGRSSDFASNRLHDPRPRPATSVNLLHRRFRLVGLWNQQCLPNRRTKELRASVDARELLKNVCIKSAGFRPYAKQSSDKLADSCHLQSFLTS
jgi:hypothetical protein